MKKHLYKFWWIYVLALYFIGLFLSSNHVQYMHVLGPCQTNMNDTCIVQNEMSISFGYPRRDKTVSIDYSYGCFNSNDCVKYFGIFFIDPSVPNGETPIKKLVQIYFHR